MRALRVLVFTGLCLATHGLLETFTLQICGDELGMSVKSLRDRGFKLYRGHLDVRSSTVGLKATTLLDFIRHREMLSRAAVHTDVV